MMAADHYTRRSEYRQVTMLFCDLVGYTPLSETLDREDLSRVMDTYEDTCQAVLTRFEGFVFRFEGDGCCAVFGYPKAHEDAAELAVRAARALSETVSKLQFPGILDEHGAPVSLRVRVGIATGRELVDASRPLERVAVRGPTPALAARLLSLADPGAVILAHATRRLVKNAFEMECLGERRLKGFADPEITWRVLSERDPETRFEAHGHSASGTMVGRQREMDALRKAWTSASDGEGRVVLVSGEPGIGKSRLMEQLREEVGHHERVRMRFQCSPFHTDSELYPVVRYLSRLSGDRDSAPSARLAMLEKRLRVPGKRRAEVMPLMADLLSIEQPGASYSRQLAPEERRRRTLDALVDHLEWLAAEQPVLLLYEDAHWQDPTSRELLDSAFERIRRLRVMMVVSHRPDAQFDRLARAYAERHAHVSRIELGSLNDAESRELARARWQKGALPGWIEEEIVARSGGVPLYIEELTSLAHGVVRMADGRPEDGAEVLSIPDTLSDPLMARLDQLDGAARYAAKLAAVIGREFSLELFERLWPREDHAMDQALRSLEDSGLVVRREEDDDPRYTFRHALIQDTAYGSLLKMERLELHAAVARCLEQHFPRVAVEQPEVLARHYAGAQEFDKAIEYWMTAARRALGRSANHEAEAHARRALAALPNLQDGRRRNELELEIHTDLGAASQALHGFASDGAKETFQNALRLAIEVGDPRQLLAARRGLFTCHHVRGEHKVALPMAEQMFEGLRATGNPVLEGLGRYIRAANLFWKAEFQWALSEFERARELIGTDAHTVTRGTHQINVIVALDFYRAWTFWMLGHPERAMQLAEFAVQSARKESRLTLAMALFVYCAVHAGSFGGRANPQRLRELAEVSATYGLKHPAATAKFLSGHDRIARGDYEAGIALIADGEADYEETRAGLGEPWGMAPAIEAHARIGKADAGLDKLEKTMAWVHEHGEYHWLADLHRIRGELLLAADPGRPDVALAALREGVEIARAQQARSLELRALTSLVALQGRLGVADGGPRELETLCESFPPGCATDDFKAAEAVLGRGG